MKEIDQARAYSTYIFFVRAIDKAAEKMARGSDLGPPGEINYGFDPSGRPSAVYHARLIHARDLLNEVIKEIAKGAHASTDEKDPAEERAR